MSSVLPRPTTGFSTVSVRPNMDVHNVASNLVPRNMPLTIPRQQVYYWTAQWQAGEREALDELERGEGRYFPTGTDAIRWLLDPED